MSNGERRWFARGVQWCIRRNPTYLASACCMAVGARMLLVEPHSRPGDVGWILLTLGVLQVYEWAVSGVLLFLHGRGRSGEDESWLLLVATLFWTGPMAATVEMTARQADLGILLAGGACMIALGELQAVRRVMRLRISPAGGILASACIVLVACAPPLLKVPLKADGSNEVFLYFTWWVLGGITLLGMGTVRSHWTGPWGQPWSIQARRDLHLEMAMLVLVVGATAAHLAGMNYAFFTHAQWFYASPVLIAVAIVATEYLACIASASRLAWAACGCLPAVAVVSSLKPFHAEVPASLLPAILRDPLASTLVFAAVAWWFGHAYCKSWVMLYAGIAAMILAAVRVTGGGTWQSATTDWPETILIVCLAGGWSWLICLHLMNGRLTFPGAIGPVAFLVVAGWAYDFDPALCWITRSHAAAMVAVLLSVGLIRPRTGCLPAGVVVALAHDVFYVGRWLMSDSHPLAALTVIAGFDLLLLGAVVSWHKANLLEMIGPQQDDHLPADE